MAERYTYVAYIGLFLAIAYYASKLFQSQKIKNISWPVLGIGLLLLGFSAFASKERVKIWKNTNTLWTSVIEQYPHTVAKAYNNRGLYLKDNGEAELALADYNKGIAIQPDNHLTLNSRGNVLNILAKRTKEKDKKLKLQKRSLADFSKAVKIRPDHYQSWNARGLTYMDMKEYEKAFSDFNQSIEIKSDYAKGFVNRASYYSATKQFDKALADYNTYLKYVPGDILVMGGIAYVTYRKGDHEAALKTIEKCLKSDPSNPQFIYLKGLCIEKRGNFKNALQLMIKAKKLGHNIPNSYIENLRKKAQN